MGQKAVVLLSGGLDSTTTLAIAKAAGYEVYALSFRYGQRHEIEIAAAQRVAASIGVTQHVVAAIDLRLFGGSALTSDIPVPKDRALAELGGDIPITYVPARNTIFLAFALAWAEVLGAQDIFIGVNAQDYSVGGAAQIWVRNGQWARLMPIERFWALPDDQYETIGVDGDTFEVGWRRVKGRFRHEVTHKRNFAIRLERGQEISITEDHSLFSINLATAALVPVKGDEITVGMPLIVPFDLSACADAWRQDLIAVDLCGICRQRAGRAVKVSIVIRDGYLTNRLGRTRVPIDFPITDEFLYLVGLWLAEGGKAHDTNGTVLSFSIGRIPGAAEALHRFFAQYQVVPKMAANEVDYQICSSVFEAIFHHLGLLGMARRGEKRFPSFFWDLSQRQRRTLIAGLWDGDGSHVFNGEATLAQKSHALIHDLYHCLTLDGIFPVVKDGAHEQKLLILARSRDFRTFVSLYPLRHSSKRAAIEAAGFRRGRDKATGLWKCEGLWNSVSAAALAPGRKTVIYNAGGKYDKSVRAQRSAFVEIPALRDLALSRLAFLRVVEIREIAETHMYDLSVEGCENFLAGGILAHNSGYPDCRPEYVAAYEHMANLATKAGVEGRQRLTIHAPLMTLTKARIIQRGLELGVNYAVTLSCYDPSPHGLACGHCDACLLRLKGFAEAGIEDPAPYQPADVPTN